MLGVVDFSIFNDMVVWFVIWLIKLILIVFDVWVGVRGVLEVESSDLIVKIIIRNWLWGYIFWSG